MAGVFSRLGRRGPEQSIVALVSVLLLFEGGMYSAVTPILPHYAGTLHAGKPAMGLLTAAYPAGIIPGSLLGGWLAARTGERRTVLVGLLVFAGSIAAFGLVTALPLLDGLRFVQGIGCGALWGGGLTWAIAVAPRERRGAVIGSVMAAATIGNLAGPILGTLAVTLGTAPVFGAVAAIALALAAWTGHHPEPPRAPAAPGPPVRALARSRGLLFGLWLILLEAGTIGATNTLIPLRLARFGASGSLVGATFLVASLISAAASAPAGRAVDRFGPAVPLSAGLASTAVLMAVLPLPRPPLLLAVLSMIALGAPLTLYTTPAVSIITSSGERAGLSLPVATMFLNLAWALGETAGAPAAANLAQATSDTVSLLGLAGLMAITLPLALRARRHTPAQGPDPAGVRAPAG